MAQDTLPVTRYARVAHKPMDDVLLDLEFAISIHNFALTARNNLGRAIRRRGHADFPDAVIVHFCNLADAREAIGIDPALMVYMPCRVAVLDQGDGVLLQTTLLPRRPDRPDFDAFARRINGILRKIVDYAAETEPGDR